MSRPIRTRAAARPATADRIANAKPAPQGAGLCYLNGYKYPGQGMRGYFGVGVDGISKPMNLGNLVRIANAFEASFFFSIAPRLKLSDAQSDTSNAQGQIPFYSFSSAADFRLPVGCRLVGVEITED